MMFLLLACSPTIQGDPLGLPLEVDAGSYNLRAGGPQGAIVGVLVVTPTGTDKFDEDWYLSPAGASGNYAPFTKPSAQNPAVTLHFQYVNASTVNPPTNPAPATGSVRWHHVVTRP